MKQWALIVLLVILAACASLLQKKGALQIVEQVEGNGMRWPVLLSTFLNPYVLLSLGVLAVTFTLWLAVLSRMELSCAYPLLVGLGTISITIASWVVFHDRMSLSRLVGVVVLCVGVFVVSKG